MVDEAKDDSTKLIIFGLGIALIAFFGYLIYKDSKQTAQLSSMNQSDLQNSINQQSANLQLITQKLSELEKRMSSLSIKSEQKLSGLDSGQENLTERKVVSMSPKIKQVNRYATRPEDFGML